MNRKLNTNIELCKIISTLIPKVLAFLCLCLVYSGVYSQDHHFSQFYISQFSNNAAFAGNMLEDVRFTGIHRSQWAKTGSAYATSGGAFDMNFEGGKLGATKIGVGIHMVNDALISGFLDRKEIGLTTAWHLPMDGINRSKFSIGAQGVLNQLSVMGPENYLWGNEFDHFNRPQQLTNVQVGEDFTATSILRLKINAGLSWSYHLSEKWDFTTSISAFGLNTPSQSIYNGVNPSNVNLVKNRYVGQVLAKAQMSDRWDLEPMLLITDHAGARNVITGSFFTFKPNDNEDEVRLAAGPFYRFGTWRTQRLENAVILASKLKIKQITLGFSYDLSISKLNDVTDFPGVDANSVGTWEVSVVYLGLLKRPAPNDYTVPCKFF